MYMLLQEQNRFPKLYDAKAKVLSTGVLLEQHFDSNSALPNALACDWGTTVVGSKPGVLALHYHS